MPDIYRAYWHDYRKRCIYMVTLAKRAGVPSFGTLAGDHTLPVGTPGSAYVKCSATGLAIEENIRNLHVVSPAIRVLQYSIMPDHVHLLLFVERDMDEILGRVIARFKVGCSRSCGIDSPFSKGFNDQILRRERSLDALYRYIRENPWRLAVRRALPDFFRRVSRFVIDGSPFQAYGNVQLLDNPFKEAVAVHRRDSEQTRAEHRAQWLYTAANGGVLVSPFISPAEKEIRRAAEALDGRVILVTDTPFPDRYKPAAHDFGLCTRGRLLIMAPETPFDGGALSRAACLAMNAAAQRIAAGTYR